MDLAPLRTQEGHAVPWDELPQDLMFKIIDLATTTRGLRFNERTSRLVKLSRVSKSWQASVKAYPASISCKAKDLQAACRAFPSLVSIFIRLDEEMSLDLSPLIGCTQLLSVAIEKSAKHPGDIDLSDLPESVRKLELRDMEIDTSMLESASHLDPAELSIVFPRGDSKLSYIPVYLPFIKKFVLTGLYDEDLAQAALYSLAELSDLTSLVVVNAIFEDPVQQIQIPADLQRLRLRNIGCSIAWIDSFLPQLVELTALELGYIEPSEQQCYFFMDNPGRDPTTFCRFPNPSLPPLQHLREVSLELGCGTKERHLQAAEVKYLAKLPALTYLQLKGAQSWPGLKALRDMRLQQLRLYECGPIEVDLIIPGALTALTELRIVSSKVMQPKEPVVVHHRQTTCEAAVALSEVCTNILQLPRLKKLVVIGPLFRLGVQDRAEEGFDARRFASLKHKLCCREREIKKSELRSYQYERMRSANSSRKNAPAGR